MKFSYKAVTKDGKTVHGVIDAKDAKGVAQYLRTHEFLPITIEEKEEKNLLRLIPFLHRSGSQNLIFFTRQLASMLTTGLTLMESLRVLREQIQNPVMVEIISNIIADVEGGKSFSLAIAKHPSVFFPIYVSLIKTAEGAGLLDNVLLRLAENLEKEQRIRDNIKSALVYPAIVIIGMIAVMCIMMIFVIPQLSVIYQSLNIPLPLPTRIIIGISNRFLTLWPFFIGFLLLLLFVFRRWYKTESGKLIVDDLVLRLPIFGKLLRETILIEFTRTLGLLISSGTLVVEALQQTAEIVGNTLYKNAVLGVAEQVEKGVNIGDAISGYSVFPPILVQMTKIGGQTGKLDESLLRVSEYFEREVEQTTKALTTAIEPIIMVVLGLGVAFLVVSIITPIYNLTSSIQ